MPNKYKAIFNIGLIMYDDIMLFINIVECGNFHKAAKQFSLAQSTITRRIQNMEDKLGMQLLQRDCRVFKLTSAGELFYKQVSNFLPECQVLLEEFHNECNNELTGTLKIGLPGISFAGLIAEFANKYPKVQIITRFLSHLIDLKKDDLNLAISVKLPISDKHKVETLRTAKFQLYASPQYIKEFGAPQTLEDFAQNHNFVSQINEDNSLVTQLVAYNEITGEELITPVKANVFAYHSRDLLGFANTHKYIIQTFDLIAAELVKKEILVQILPQFTFGNIEIYLITPNRILSRLEQEFINWVHQSYSYTCLPTS